MPISPKFPEDIVPLSDIKVNPGRIVKQLDKTHRPVLLTSRGRGVAVVQSLRIMKHKRKSKRFYVASFKD